MTIFFAKFIWADWLLDHALRRCSPEARGLWMDMLALSVRSEPVGVLADGHATLMPADIARLVGMRKESVARLIGELERNGVFSRDEHGRIYSRRIVREHGARRVNKANGARGGNPQLAAKNASAPDNPHKLEVKSQESEVTSQQSPRDAAAPQDPAAPPGTAAPVTPSPQPGQRRTQLPRAVAAMGTTMDAIYRKMGWMAFDDTFANWLEQGCDAERDIWPTIAALTAKRGAVPASPNYFAGAIREARDRRTAFALPKPLTLGAPYLASTAIVAPPAFVDPQTLADRRAVFERTGVWSTHWGPKPERAAGETAARQAAE